MHDEAKRKAARSIAVGTNQGAVNQYSFARISIPAKATPVAVRGTVGLCCPSDQYSVRDTSNEYLRETRRRHRAADPSGCLPSRGALAFGTSDESTAPDQHLYRDSGVFVARKPRVADEPAAVGLLRQLPGR